jgi:type VI secretion system protein ImpA
MQAQFESQLPDYFSRTVGVAFEQLTAPISGARPGGENLRSNGVYRSIQEARREDDATVPMGPWTRELKRAEWDRVAELAASALAGRSKDLQLAAWLLEAQIHRDGFAAIAPCTTLLRVLCERHWDCLYPRADGGADLEYRTNVIHWMNEKLLPVLRLVPLTQAVRESRPFNWADWEQARRNEQHRATRGDQESFEGANVLEFSAAMAGTPTEWHRGQYGQLDDALESLEQLTATLNHLCGEDSPSLQHLSGLLEQIQTLLGSELHKRGVALEIETGATLDNAQFEPARSAPGVPEEIRDRAAAYAKLAELADFLQHIEPHSPVPYLLKRAVSWGNLNTAELYQEMFVKFGGQLNIFEMLGIAASAAQGKSP